MHILAINYIMADADLPTYLNNSISSTMKGSFSVFQGALRYHRVHDYNT